MRRTFLPRFLLPALRSLVAAPTPKEQLMTPPAGRAPLHDQLDAPESMATSGRGRMPDGKHRLSHVDVAARLGDRRRRADHARRRRTPDRDRHSRLTPIRATRPRISTSTTTASRTGRPSVDSGSAPFGAKRYNTYGGPWLAGEQDIEALVAAGDKGIDLLPNGHASISIGQVGADRRAAGAEDGQARLHQRLWLLARSRLARQRQSLFRLRRDHLAAARGL